MSCLVSTLLASREFGIAWVLVLLVVGFGLISPQFWSPGNLLAILRSTAYVGIVAIGMGVCLINGLIDLSVGATAGMAGVLMAHLIVELSWPWWLAIPAGLASGIAMGVLNWTLIVRLRITPFIATIGTMYLARGIATVVSNAYSIYPLPSWMGEIATASPLGLSVVFFAFVTLAVLMEVILKRTLWGLKIRATGSDREVAKCTEVDVDFSNLTVLILVGLLAAVAGVFLAGKLIAAQPTAGIGWELIAITACAIGGVSLFGYEGSMIGVFLGMLTMQVIVNGMIVIGLSPHLQQGVTGIILLLAMSLDMYRRDKMLIMEKVRNEY